MKRYVARGLVFGAIVLAVGSWGAVAQADDDAKAVGDWDLKVLTDDGQTLASVLKLTQEDGKLKGVFVGMDGTEVKADEVSLKGDDLNFKVTLDFQGTELVAKFALKQEGSNLKGTVDYDLGGQTGTLDVTGGRAAAGKGKIGEGTWNLEIQTDDGQTLKAAVNLKKDGDKLGGTFVGVDGTEVKLDEASVKDNELAFKVTVDFQGSELVAKFKLKPDDAAQKAPWTMTWEVKPAPWTSSPIARRATRTWPANGTSRS